MHSSTAGCSQRYGRLLVRSLWQASSPRGVRYSVNSSRSITTTTGIRTTTIPADASSSRLTTTTSPCTLFTTAKQKDDDKQNKQKPPPRDIPRKITVKTQQPPQQQTTTTTTTATPSYGHLKKRKVRMFNLERPLQDASGITIWWPPKKKDDTTTTPHPLDYPTLVASAFLDPYAYVRTRHMTSNGTEAARRLLRGKKNLLQVLRSAVHSTPTVTTTCRLQGHGIPQQLIQHFLDTLGHHDVLNNNDNNTMIRIQHTSPPPLVAHKKLPAWAVTHLQGRVWKITNGEEQELYSFDGGTTDNLLLYWTVMHRVTSQVGWVVLWRQQQHHRHATNNNNNHGPKKYEVEFRRSSTTTNNNTLWMEWNPLHLTSSVIVQGQGVVLQFTAMF